MEKSKMKKAFSVTLSLLSVLILGGVLVNCGGSSGGGGTVTPPPPAASVDYKRTEVSAFRTNPDYTYIHGNASIPDYKRIMVEDFRGNGNYIYIHGNASPDGQKLFVSVNDTLSGQGGTSAGMTGTFTNYMLTMSDVVGGVTSTNSVELTSTATGSAGTTIAFRSSFTPDGTKIVQAGNDRVVVLDASDLSVLKNDTNIKGTASTADNHDALAIDNDLALLAVQLVVSSGTNSFKTGGVELYNLTTGRIGNPVPICTTCHDPATLTKSKTLCGIDGKFTKNAGTGVYTGTLYVATTSGGHIATAALTIDPSNTTTPITVGAMARIQVSTGPGATPNTMPMFHDVRLDNTTNRVYYSGYKVSTATATAGRTHLGYVDLADSSVHDASIPATAGAQSGSVYCGSGQTADYFIPMTMSYPAYIDVIRKTAITTGAALSSTPAALYVALNETPAGQGGTGNMTGEFTAYLLKMSDVTAGTVTSSSIIGTPSKVTGVAAKTIAFRTSFTPDGTKIVQAGNDRVVVLDASDLSVLKNDTDIKGTASTADNHDALAIDNNYALLAVQLVASSATNSFRTGGVELYNLTTGRIGNPVPICTTCHDPATLTKSKTLCGIDGKFTKNASTGVYTGKLYVATTSGGHVATADLTIDPSNTTTPITVGTMARIQVSTGPGATPNTMPMFHDVRLDLDANRVYYSGYKVSTATATAGRTHLGYVDLADNSVHDGSIPATSGAQTGSVYCGSGQTADYFIPMTMSYPAYIDAIKKSAITHDAVLK